MLLIILMLLSTVYELFFSSLVAYPSLISQQSTKHLALSWGRAVSHALEPFASSQNSSWIQVHTWTGISENKKLCSYEWLQEWHVLDHAAVAAAKSLQSCQILCDPRDGSPPGSPVPGILQARALEWVAISFLSYIIYLKNYLKKIQPLGLIENSWRKILKAKFIRQGCSRKRRRHAIQPEELNQDQ